MKSYCKNWRQIALKVDVQSNDLMLVRIGCGKWSCDYCARRNRSLWREHLVKRLGEMGGQWIFCTITAHGNAQKAGRTVENLKRCWKLLYDRLRRRFKGQKLEYALVFEPHAAKVSGQFRYHIHFILRAELAGENVWDARAKTWKHVEFTRWLKDNAAAAGGGYIAHAAKVSGASGYLATMYITKYMSKSALGWQGFPKGFRRIIVSRGVGSPDRGSSGWQVKAGIHKSELVAHPVIRDLSTGLRVKESDFHEIFGYPVPEGALDD